MVRASDVFNVLEFGAVADGQTDNTAAFQRALDAAAQRGGGVVYAPRGNYRFAGSLRVPPAVTLRGVWESVPAHNGIRDRGLPKPTDDGTTFLVTGGAGSEDGPPFITLHHNSTLKGVVIYYPDQDPESEPKPYPWAIAMRGKNPAVLAVELLNPYNGIDASENERHLIRDVHGQPLRRGIYVDAIYDIGRIEDVLSILDGVCGPRCGPGSNNTARPLFLGAATGSMYSTRSVSVTAWGTSSSPHVPGCATAISWGSVQMTVTRR